MLNEYSSHSLSYKGPRPELCILAVRISSSYFNPSLASKSTFPAVHSQHE